MPKSKKPCKQQARKPKQAPACFVPKPTLERFIELNREADVHKKEIDRITFDQMELAFQVAKEITTQAFPGVPVVEVMALAIIKPSDYAKSATEVVKALQDAGITPSAIHLDPNRKVVTLIK